MRHRGIWYVTRSCSPMITRIGHLSMIAAWGFAISHRIERIYRNGIYVIKDWLAYFIIYRRYKYAASQRRATHYKRDKNVVTESLHRRWWKSEHYIRMRHTSVRHFYEHARLSLSQLSWRYWLKSRDSSENDKRAWLRRIERNYAPSFSDGVALASANACQAFRFILFSYAHCRADRYCCNWVRQMKLCWCEVIERESRKAEALYWDDQWKCSSWLSPYQT